MDTGSSHRRRIHSRQQDSSWRYRGIILGDVILRGMVKVSAVSFRSAANPFGCSNGCGARVKGVEE